MRSGKKRNLGGRIVLGKLTGRRLVAVRLAKNPTEQIRLEVIDTARDLKRNGSNRNGSFSLTLPNLYVSISS